MRRASAICELAAAANAPRLAAALVDRTVQVWNPFTAERLSRLETVFSFGGHRLALNPTGELCVAAGWSKGKRGGVACYDVSNRTLVWHRTDIRQTQDLRFSRDGEIVRCGVDAGRFQELDAVNGTTVRSLVGIRRVFDSPNSTHQLLETRQRGYVIRGDAKDVHVANLTFALLDVAFSRDVLCLSEAGGPARCIDCHSGVEQWRYDPPQDTHVLRLHYRQSDGSFYGIQWEYNRGTSRTLFRFARDGGRYQEIRQLRSSEEVFCGDTLVTSLGEVISLAKGDVVNLLEFPQSEYPEDSGTEVALS